MTEFRGTPLTAPKVGCEKISACSAAVDYLSMQDGRLQAAGLEGPAGTDVTPDGQIDVRRISNTYDRLLQTTGGMVTTFRRCAECILTQAEVMIVHGPAPPAAPQQ